MKKTQTIWDLIYAERRSTSYKAFSSVHEKELN